MFGVALRTAREDRGLSMFALAKLARVDRSTVHRLEQGQQAPNKGTARKLSRVLERAPVRRIEQRYLRDRVRHDEVTAYVTKVHPHGLTIEQVASVLRLSPMSVKDALSSAIRKIVGPLHDVSPEGDDVRLWRARLREMVQHQAEHERESPWPRGLDQVDEDDDARPLNWWCGDYDGDE